MEVILYDSAHVNKWRALLQIAEAVSCMTWQRIVYGILYALASCNQFEPIVQGNDCMEVYDSCSCVGRERSCMRAKAAERNKRHDSSSVFVRFKLLAAVVAQINVGSGQGKTNALFCMRKAAAAAPSMGNLVRANSAFYCTSTTQTAL